MLHPQEGLNLQTKTSSAAYCQATVPSCPNMQRESVFWKVLRKWLDLEPTQTNQGLSFLVRMQPRITCDLARFGQPDHVHGRPGSRLAHDRQRNAASSFPDWCGSRPANVAAPFGPGGSALP